MRTLWRDEDGAWRTTLRGRQVLADPRINKGTAFGDSERRDLGLTGLIPAAHFTLDDQVARVYAQYRHQPDDLARNVTLNALHDRNEVLFYRLLTGHLSEMLPIVYTPTVGQAIEHYSHEYRRPRGIYLSVDHPELIEASLLASDLGPDEVDLIVATDAGAILGIGDWGVGGIHIAVGKLAVYTAAGGIDPARTIPVMLDVGTDRQSLLDDPLYIGNRHPRVPAAEYDAFLDEFVRAVGKLFPLALLHWEDLGVANARRLLERYRDERLTFNDDIQGTGAVNLAAVLAATRATGVPLTGHRIVIFGMGTAGAGIADQLTAAMVAEGVPEAQARRRFWAVDRQGLLTRDMTALSDLQRRYARDPAEVADWRRDGRLGKNAVAGERAVPGGHMARRGGRLRSGRGGRPGAPHGADRDLDEGRGVHRGGRPRHGGPHRAAGDPPDVQPDRFVRGGTGRPHQVDRRPCAGRRREPVWCRGPRRHPLRDRPGQQRPDLPGPGPRRDRRPGAARDRRDAAGSRPRGRRAGGHLDPGRSAAAAGGATCGKRRSRWPPRSPGPPRRKAWRLPRWTPTSPAR